MIAVVGLSHRTAPVGIREKIAVHGPLSRAGVDGLKSRPSELMILSTCNRVELWASTDGARADTAAALRELLLQHAGDLSAETLSPHLFEFFGDEAVEHIFRVAASLDSLVVGEPQILGQLKSAYARALEAKTVGGVLGRCVEKAFGVAKRVRTETSLAEGSVSVSSVAVDLAQRIFGDLSTCSVLLVGAGEMAEAAARALGRGTRAIRVCNRSEARGLALAESVDGVVARWDQLERELAFADVVVTSTSAEIALIDRAMVQRVMRERRGKTLFFIDIAVPRNVDPGVHAIDNVYVYNVDDLEELVAEAMSSRLSEVDAAEAIVKAESASFIAWFRARSVQPTITRLRRKLRGILVSECERALSGRLQHLPAGDKEAIRQLMDATANKLLHTPSIALKEIAEASTDGAVRAEEFAASLRYLFELREDSTDGEIPSQLESSTKGQKSSVMVECRCEWRYEASDCTGRVDEPTFVKGERVDASLLLCRNCSRTRIIASRE